MYSNAKKSICIMLILALIVSIVPNTLVNAAYGDVYSSVEKFDNVLGNDLRGISNSLTLDIIETLDFDDQTIWPNSEKMPQDLKIGDLVEFGKDPGLGIRELHNLGYTGKGISVAIFDQPLTPNHEAYDNVEYTYSMPNPDPKIPSVKSLHGPVVMSFLAGRELGTAPDVKVYYYAYPSWQRDQKNEADLFYEVIEKNKTLPEGEKIRIISMSHGVDSECINSELLADAERAAREAGIIVVDVGSTKFNPVTARAFTDKDDPSNYIKGTYGFQDSESLYVPVGRTGPNGYSDEMVNDRYTYWGSGGLSWAVPFTAGVIALGLQINPNLTESEAFDYLFESGYDFNGGKLINPEGFVRLVEKSCKEPRDVTMDMDYILYLYSKDSMNSKDMESFEGYISKLNNGTRSIIVDVSGFDNALDIYEELKTIIKNEVTNCVGVQIIGTEEEVPSFNVHYKVQMFNGIDDSGIFKSDHFYSNINSTDLYDNISIYDVFEKKLNVDLIPQWPVGRLLLKSGEIENYFTKYYEYKMKSQGVDPKFVDFSSPIFNQINHIDDTGVLLTRMSDEMNLIGKDFYRIYGNTQGKYPVTTKALGDFTKENLIQENMDGIINLSINSHGQSNNIDQYIVESTNSLADIARNTEMNDKGEFEHRISLLDSDNINEALSHNYFTLFSRSCNNAFGLTDNNLIHEAMANGKLISAVSQTTVNSNNGINVNDSISEMKFNNPAYNYLLYVLSLSKGNTMSDSFYKAKKGYSMEVLKPEHQRVDIGEGNFQFQVLNILSQHYFGLLDYDKGSTPLKTLLILIERKSNHQLSDQSISSSYSLNNASINELPVISKKQSDWLSKVDDKDQYLDISKSTTRKTPEIDIGYVGAAMDDLNIYIKIKYTSPFSEDIVLFLQGDAPGLFKYTNGATRIGNNTIIVKFAKSAIKVLPIGIAFNLGGLNFLFIDKPIMDSLANAKPMGAKPNINIDIFGSIVKFDNTTGIPFIDAANRTQVPLRAAMETYGCQVTWDSTERIATVSKDSILVTVPVGKSYITKNGQMIVTDTIAQIKDGRTYLPIRAVLEAFGASVSWDNDSKTVLVR